MASWPRFDTSEDMIRPRKPTEGDIFMANVSKKLREMVSAEPFREPFQEQFDEFSQPFQEQFNDPSRDVYGRPGRLAPRWLQDLDAGALADGNADSGHLFTACEALPDRLVLPTTPEGDETKAWNGGVPAGNGHELLFKESQTLINETEEVVSCMCKHCKYHFVFEFKKVPGPRCGNGLGDKFPLCHLVLANSQVVVPHQEHNKWHPCSQTARWKCSAARCPVEVVVSISRPRMQLEHVRWIVSEERIRRQRQEALAQDPDRFANLNENLEMKPLVTLNAYLRDSLTHNASSEPRKVASRNKIFVVQFGPSSLPIFRYLGFEVSVIDGEEYLILPRPPTPAGKTPIGSMRAFYEDARSEIMALIEETGREQVQVHHHPAKARLERALSCYNHPYTASLTQQDDPRDFQALGATANSSEFLLQFAFLCQVQTNPAKKADYFSALRSLASSRSSDMQMFAAVRASMEDAERQPSTDPLVQAYDHFSFVDEFHDDASIIARYHLLCCQFPEQNKNHRLMLLRIGQARGSQAINDVARDMTDFKEACQFLDIAELEDQSSADVLLSFIETQVKGGKDPSLVAAALDTIADKINSPEMKASAQFYRDLGNQGGRLDEPMVTDAVVADGNDSENINLPLGLDNLRNTCYLNSILQYFFTVKAVRTVVLNFDPDKVPLTEATRKDGEVYLGREFVLELKRLFSELDSTSARFVKPQQRLANAAWISVDTVQKNNNERSAVPADAQSAATAPIDSQSSLPTRPVPAAPSHGTETKHTVTVDSVPENLETASISSSQTLTNQHDGSPDFESGNVVVKAVADGTSGETSTTESGEDAHKEEKKPNSEVLIEALKDALAQTEIHGTEQMDVEEVMGRCINHLRAAINPASVTNANEVGVHRDEIMENLYITFANSRKEKGAPKYNRNTSQERWVTANPATSGSLSLYDALDNYFEREFIGNKLISFTSIVTAPPIFHVCIQRSQVGGGKNTNPVAIPEVLHLDRYMESDQSSALFRARKRSWDIKSQLKDLEQAPAFGDSEAVAGSAAGSVEVFMKKRGANPSGSSAEADEDGFDVIDPRIKDVLDRHGNPLPHAFARSTTPDLTDSSDDDDEDVGLGHTKAVDMLEEMVSKQKTQLREELDGLFVNMKNHKYRLHSVICHAGQTAKSGHYWVWIFDFDQNIWRKYNDRIVTENTDTQAVLDELSTRGEPYYVMYVRDEDKNDLVSVPRLKQYKDTTPDVEMAEWAEPTSEHMENIESALAPSTT